MTNKASAKLELLPLIPYAFECPACDHFPLKRDKKRRDTYHCGGKCSKSFVLLLDIFGDWRFLEDRGRKGVADYPAICFERVPGSSRARGPRVFS